MSQNNKISCQYTVEKLQQLVNKVCHSRQISLYHHRFGPKKYTQHQWVALLILKAKTGLSLRRFIQYLYESKWPEWLGLKEIPSKSGLDNHFQKLGLKFIRVLNQVIVKAKKSVDVAIDSTGLDTRHASKHYEKRIGRIRSPYLKLSIFIETKDLLLIHDFVADHAHVHDVNHAKVMCKRTKIKNKIITLDKAYDCEELHEINEIKGNISCCPVRNFKVKKPKGRLRRIMVKNFDKNIYSQRNKAETVMFLLKQNGFVIRAKKLKNQIKEVAWKIISYNIERLANSFKVLANLISFWTTPRKKKIYKVINYINIMNNRENQSVDIIIPAYNEEKNLKNILNGILSQDLSNFRVFIYSDGSTDNTYKIAREFSKKYPYFFAFNGIKRKGKIFGINFLLKKIKGEIVIMQSADSVPGKDAYKNLLSPLKKASIGVVTSKIIPLNKGEKQMEEMAKLVYKLHHEISKKSPKFGEMIAFLNIIESLPVNAVCDEEMIAQIIYSKGYKGFYCHNAIVFIMAPQTIKDYIKQRRRIVCGHIDLKKTYGHQASTTNSKILLKTVMKISPPLKSFILGCLIKSVSNILGRYDYAFKKNKHVKWEIVGSVKKLF